MAPRPYQPTVPRTDAARAATSAFQCALCKKGYTRQNDYDSHLSSYEHTHAQRLIDMKKLTADPRAAEKQAKAARRENKDMVRLTSTKGPTIIKAGGGGFTKIQDLAKKAEDKDEEAAKPKIVDGDSTMKGFRNVVNKANVEKLDGVLEKMDEMAEKPNGVVEMMEEEVESEEEDIGYEYYDPRCPTGCGPDCEGWCEKLDHMIDEEEPIKDGMIKDEKMDYEEFVAESIEN